MSSRSSCKRFENCPVVSTIPAERSEYEDGFQRIGNPIADTTNKLVASFILSGQCYWQFCFIDKNGTLRDIGPKFNSDPIANDYIEYQKAFEAAKTDMQDFLWRNNA